MKKILVSAIAIFIAFNVFSNEENIIKETFDKNVFKWEEYTDKKLGTVIIQNGYLTLNAKKSILSPKTRFPIDINRDFKVTYKFVVPVLDNKSSFGLSFSATDEQQGVFMVSKGSYALTYRGITKNGKLPLKGGKDQTGILSMEKRGNTLIFSVNGMTACEIKEELQSPRFGVVLHSPLGKTTLLVDEIIINQYQNEN